MDTTTATAATTVAPAVAAVTATVPTVASTIMATAATVATATMEATTATIGATATIATDTAAAATTATETTATGATAMATTAMETTATAITATATMATATTATATKATATMVVETTTLEETDIWMATEEAEEEIHLRTTREEEGTTMALTEASGEGEAALAAQLQKKDHGRKQEQEEKMAKIDRKTTRNGNSMARRERTRKKLCGGPAICWNLLDPNCERD